MAALQRERAVILYLVPQDAIWPINIITITYHILRGCRSAASIGLNTGRHRTGFAKCRQRLGCHGTYAGKR
ncbi:MAG: hypothetical protein ACJ8AW_35065, partial [Rhodopila sp.]